MPCQGPFRCHENCKCIMCRSQTERIIGQPLLMPSFSRGSLMVLVPVEPIAAAQLPVQAVAALQHPMLLLTQDPQLERVLFRPGQHEKSS